MNMFDHNNGEKAAGSPHKYPPPKRRSKNARIYVRYECVHAALVKDNRDVQE
jgi:hypothetical protein